MSYILIHWLFSDGRSCRSAIVKPHKIALSLKHSAEGSDRKKSSPYRSAMSMLTFYINRAGEQLEAKQHKVLEAAKDELRKVFGKG